MYYPNEVQYLGITLGSEDRERERERDQLSTYSLTCTHYSRVDK